MFGCSSPKALIPARDPGEMARRPLHVIRQLRPEQIGTGIGEIGGLHRKACGDEGASERALVAGLGITLIGHVLHGDRAHVIFGILIEHRPCRGHVVRHHIAADQAAGIAEAFGMFVGRGIQQ
jgi:hypothetical protein